MEVVCGLADDDCVAGVVTSGGATAESGTLSEDVHEFTLALVAPLGAENEGGRHVQSRGEREDR